MKNSNKNKLVHVVSFSGGRTSAYLVHLMEERRKKENITVKYLFMDTGAEHPETYEFIKNVVKHFKIELVCLRTKFNPILGQKNDYEIIPIENIRQDLKPWKGMTEKYGTPYNPGGAFCTRAMKTDIYEWYCNEKFGLKNYISWLGIRADEPKRLKDEGDRLSEKQKRWYADLKYLADISDFEKTDILDWWNLQPFDLGIPEHLGNCVYCIKKGINKVALATKDEPLMADSFNKMLKNPKIRIVEKRKSSNEIMYRGKNSFESVIALFSDVDRDELYYSLRGNKQEDSGNCSESCEIINGDEENELPEPIDKKSTDILNHDRNLEKKRLKTKQRKKAVAKDTSHYFDEYNGQKFDVIYADPAWKFSSGKTGGSMNSGAGQKYDVMTIKELKSMPVQKLASDNCLLVMWWVGAMPQEAIDLVESWGFKLKNMNGFVWNKLTVKKLLPFFGMGYFTRAGSESAIIATKGKPSIKSRSVRAVYNGPVGKHSEKPNEFRIRINKLMGKECQKIELFARTKAEGFKAWGNQIDK